MKDHKKRMQFGPCSISNPSQQHSLRRFRSAVVLLTVVVPAVLVMLAVVVVPATVVLVVIAWETRGLLGGLCARGVYCEFGCDVSLLTTSEHDDDDDDYDDDSLR